MNKHLEIAVKTHEEHGIDFQQLLAWHLAFGVVISCESYFAIGFYCLSEKPNEAVESHHADTLFVTFCVGDMRQAITPFLDKYEYIAFQRSFQNSDRIRLFNIHDFYSKLK